MIAGTMFGRWMVLDEGMAKIDFRGQVCKQVWVKCTCPSETEKLVSVDDLLLKVSLSCDKCKMG